MLRLHSNKSLVRNQFLSHICSASNLSYISDTYKHCLGAHQPPLVLPQVFDGGCQQ